MPYIINKKYLVVHVMRKICLVFIAAIFLLSSCGRTISLETALYKEDFKAVKKAIKKGADVNSVIDKESGATALMIAASGKSDESSEIVKYLLKKGADDKAVDFSGKTALMYAAINSCPQNAEILIDNNKLFFINFADVDTTDFDNYTALAYAVVVGDVDTCQVLIENGADINRTVGADSDEFSMVRLVISNGTPEILNLFIENKAKINQVDSSGGTPLIYSIIYNNENAFKILVRSGADPNLTDLDKNPPINYAIYYQLPNIVEMLLSNGADVNAVDSEGQNALHILSMEDEYSEAQLDMAKTLLNYGIDINAETKSKQTALMLAIANGNSEIARFLIENGCDIFIADNDGWNALVYSIYYENADIVDLLLEEGADVYSEFTSDEYVHSAFEMAVSTGNIEIINALIDYGVDINMEDPNGLPFWLYSVIYNQPQVLKEMINQGVVLDYVDEDGITPVIVAAIFLAADIIPILVANGLYVDEADYGGWTALHYACYSKEYGYPESMLYATVASLISSGADVNVRDIDGCTPLMVAAGSGVPSVVELLIQCGADLNLVDSFNQRAITYGAESMDYKTCNLLIEAGAVLNYEDVNAITPLFIALQQDANSITNLFVKAGADVNQVFNGRSPISIAIENNNLNAVNLLIRAGADIIPYDSAGNSPMVEAGYYHSYNVISSLVGSGLDVNSINPANGYTALISACINKSDDIDDQEKTIKQLINNGADVNLLGNDGNSALSGAILSDCDLSIIKILIDNGADLDILIGGMNLLKFAKVSNASDDIIDLLFSLGFSSAIDDLAS